MEKLKRTIQIDKRGHGFGGKVTRQTAEDFSKHYGWEPIQIDGIPEGFSFLAPDLTIGGKEHKGGYYALVPGYDLMDEGSIVKADTPEGLLSYYERNLGKL